MGPLVDADCVSVNEILLTVAVSALEPLRDAVVESVALCPTRELDAECSNVKVPTVGVRSDDGDALVELVWSLLCDPSETDSVAV